MGIFTDLFNWRPDKEEENLDIGRFSDAYKPQSSYKTWEESLLAFEMEDHEKSTTLFLDFLKSKDEENLVYQNKEGTINFHFFQGSKKVTGYQNKEKFRAEVSVAISSDLNIGLLRRLLDRNYLLKYSRFALQDDGTITMLFDSYTVDASPNKLYQGLKEMAIQADKLDDIIIDEFVGLEPINTGHTIDRSDETKDKQYRYMIDQIDNCMNEIRNGKLNTDQFPGGLSFLLLALNYKLDYLLKPEGHVMDILEENHRKFFANDGKEVGLKNKNFIDSFAKIKEREESKVKSELYNVISTFGLTTPTPHETLASLITSELAGMQWYKENGHHAIALSIPTYVVGFSLFNYALPLPDIELLRLYYKVLEPEFFYVDKSASKYYSRNTLNSRNIKKDIEHILDRYKVVYPQLDMDTNKISFDNEVAFAESYLSMIGRLNLEKA